LHWLRIQFRVDAQDYEQLSELLEACLALSVSVENAGEDEFFEVAFPQKPTWKKTSVTALFYPEVDVQAIIDLVNKQISPQQALPVVVEEMQEQDWERVWLDQYKPLQISEHFWVVPSWLDEPDTNSSVVNLRMDPGLAFGTGTHATTFLCLEWLAKTPNEYSHVLDYGAGSGILAISSLLLGAKQATLVDIDPMAVVAAESNLVLNKVDHLAQVLQTSDFEIEEQKYDLVIANILAEVLINEAEMLLKLLSEGGKLMLSGILSEQEDSIKSAFSQFAQLSIDKFEKEGWLMLIISKN
jgi:ribosomal protein L11 methyltransferase